MFNDDHDVMMIKTAKLIPQHLLYGVWQLTGSFLEQKAYELKFFHLFMKTQHFQLKKQIFISTKLHIK